MNNAYTQEQGQTLLNIARQSIEHGLSHQKSLLPELDSLEETLQQQRATFVTLEIKHQLRGCIGSLQAYRSLATDVAENAFAAAFLDTRFSPLTRAEFDKIDIHISVLSPPEPMTFSSEHDLLQQLRPGTDGLIIHLGNQRATFLPSVWEQLPNPKDFLAHLKQKAGLPPNYWSKHFQAERYTAESIK